MAITNDKTNVKIKYGSTSSNLTNLPVDDGSLILKQTSDTNFKLYADNTNRKELTVSNSDTTTKLKTACTISLGGSTTSDPITFDGSQNVTIPVGALKESYLTWSSENYKANSVGPIPMAISAQHSANRFAFANPAGIKFETSIDGGTTWTTPSWDSHISVKLNLCNGIGTNLPCGDKDPNASKAGSVTDKLRITLSSSAMQVYSILTKLFINITTNGATAARVFIEYSIKALLQHLKLMVNIQ